MSGPTTPHGPAEPLTPAEPPWLLPESLTLGRRLLTSHRRAFGRALLGATEQVLNDRQVAQELFAAPMAILAHDGGRDPRLNYANRTALVLWRHRWSSLVGLPSRLTAEPEQRADRQAMLERARQQGALEGYTGVRIDSRGGRFLIQRARLWTLHDGTGSPCGQAAAFSDWSRLP